MDNTKVILRTLRTSYCILQTENTADVYDKILGIHWNLLDVFNGLIRGHKAKQVPHSNNLCKQCFVNKLKI